MQYTFVKACLLALATTSTVLAQTAGFNVISAPSFNEELEAGSTYTIKWAPTEPAAPISLILMQGANNISLSLAPGFIAEGIDSAAGQYEWAVPADPTFALYGIKLQLDSDPETFQYSNPFTISGGSDAPSPTGKATTIHISEVSTSTTAEPAPSTSTSASSTENITSTSTTDEPETTESSAIEPATTELANTVDTIAAPSTTLDTTTFAAATTTLTGEPSTTTQPSAANSNNAIGAGLIGAIVMVLALF